MTRQAQAIKDAEAYRDKLRQQIAELQQQLLGAENMLKHMKGENIIKQKTRAPRSNVKQLVLKELQAAKHSGANAQTICDAADNRGEPVERGTVSSLLSRLKNEGTVTYDGGMYRLSEFSVPPRAHPTEATSAVH